MEKNKLIALVGPTASGKSTLALQLAQVLNGEIIAMDSMQIYRHMDIGTAKATKEEQRLVPHYMIDIVDPRDSYNVARYREDALKAINQVYAKGKQPILAGGTGLYYQALLQPVELGNTLGDEKFRLELEKEAALEGGRERLHQALREKDPAAGKKIHMNDIKRVIRALEVIQATGEPFSAQKGLWRAEEDLPYHLISLAVDWPRETLYRRIEERVDQMIEKGLLDEVGALLTMGVGPGAQSMQGIGYKELVPVLLEGKTLAKAVEELKQNTRRYGKRQLTWFRRYDHIKWLKNDDKLFKTALEECVKGEGNRDKQRL